MDIVACHDGQRKNRLHQLLSFKPGDIHLVGVPRTISTVAHSIRYVPAAVPPCRHGDSLGKLGKLCGL
jgi:hypothetical protein